MKKKSSPSKATKKELPVRLFRTPAVWRAWLDKQHAEPDGIWLKFAKKGSGIRSINYAQALDEALCYAGLTDKLSLLMTSTTYSVSRLVGQRASGRK